MSGSCCCFVYCFVTDLVLRYALRRGPPSEWVFCVWNECDIHRDQSLTFRWPIGMVLWVYIRFQLTRNGKKTLPNLHTKRAKKGNEVERLANRIASKNRTSKQSSTDETTEERQARQTNNNVHNPLFLSPPHPPSL